MTLTRRHRAAWLETRSLASSVALGYTGPAPLCLAAPPVKHRPPAHWRLSSALVLPRQSSPSTANQRQDAAVSTERRVNAEGKNITTSFPRHGEEKKIPLYINKMIGRHLMITITNLIHTDDLAHPDVQSGGSQLIILPSASPSCLSAFSSCFW